MSMFFMGSFAKQDQEKLALDNARQAYYEHIEADKYIREYIPKDLYKYQEIAVVGRMFMEKRFVFRVTFP